MRRLLFLAWRYALYHRLRTVLLTFSLCLTIAIPVTVHLLTGTIQEALLRRAQGSPFVVGSPGSAADLTVNSLYFEEIDLPPFTYGQAESLTEDELVTAVPLHVKYSTREYPIVGTTLEYFRRRRLLLHHGSEWERLGDCMLGAEVAKKLELGVGDFLISDSESFLKPVGALPLRMRIQGVLAPTGTSDDRAVFVHVRTAWLLEGIGHGHDAALHTTEDGGTAGAAHAQLAAAGVQFLEVNEENQNSFHFHGEPDQFPLTAALVFPSDNRSGLIWEGRQQADPDLLTVRPVDVVEQLVNVLVNVQRVVDGIVLALGVIVGVLFTVVVIFSLQLRRDEMQTFQALGASRWLTAQLILCDLLLILLLTPPFTALLTVGLYYAGHPWIERILF
ncbi:ABC transporter permease [Rubinisphaera margarita]|uniref:ABC transporter permease n=1 Tax=Rubinisphaera margarita TaxID=2909586 RepID=UPI001EE83976|nr:ABC transporter permease [Rubinisphaera margarita]MCG6156217.1 hypothetical protein [Rubinisphaera margarita]